MSRLIVNADDFGLTTGVNRAILELHQAGVLTSATLMARAAATEEAIALARATPTLGVGCHVVLVDGEPVLPPAEIPTLVGQPASRLHPTLGAFLPRLLRGGILSSQIEAEATAQIRLLQSRGLTLTHIDTHKHTHMFREVLRPVLRAARSAGIRVVRNPFEPAWSVRATPRAPWLRRTQVNLLRRMYADFRRIVDEEGFTTTDGALGVLATGTLDTATIASLVRHLPQGTWELVTHPGYNDDALAQANTRLLVSRETEYGALLAAGRIPDVEYTSFASLNTAPGIEKQGLYSL